MPPLETELPIPSFDIPTEGLTQLSDGVQSLFQYLMGYPAFGLLIVIVVLWWFGGDAWGEKESTAGMIAFMVFSFGFLVAVNSLMGWKTANVPNFGDKPVDWSKAPLIGQFFQPTVEEVIEEPPPKRRHFRFDEFDK